MKEHEIKDVGTLGKKAAELWGKMEEAEKKPYVDKYEKDKAEYEAWKETAAGKEALAKLKEQKDQKKEAKLEKVDKKKSLALKKRKRAEAKLEKVDKKKSLAL